MNRTLLQQLANAIASEVSQDGEHSAADGLKLYRNSGPTEPSPCMYQFGLGVVVQGVKDVLIGEHTYSLSAGDFMIAAADIPVMSSVTNANKEAPYLGLWIDLNLDQISKLAADIPATPSTPEQQRQGITIEPLTEDLAATLLRAPQLLKSPDLIPHLLPLIQQEVIVRLLAGPQGNSLRELIQGGSATRRITDVIHWLKRHYDQDLPVADLAAMASMSTTAFRQHFREMTGLSPLQYRKQIRLMEARQLMLHSQLDASSSAFRVGYESASQFSREYTRLFGSPPKRDIQRLRSAF